MTAIRKSEGRFVETEVDGEVVIMNLDTGNFFALEETGLAIWRLIDGNIDRESLVARLAEQFGETADAIREEIYAFLQSLKDAGLIESGGD